MMTTQKMKADLNKIWSELDSRSTKQVARHKISILEHLDCYIGIVGYTGAKIFQIEVDAHIEIHKNYVHRFRGVETQVIPSEDGTLNKFTIFLMQNELRDVFTLFVDDIVNELISVTQSTDALRVINHRILYWRNMFARASGELLSPERQRGLFGELFILNHLLLVTGDSSKIVHSWVGSQSANQDFTIESSAIEVKTSKAGKPIISVSNEFQLDWTDWKNLFLCLVSVTESAGKEGTLSELIHDIKSNLNKDPKLESEFERRLDLAGISHDMVEEYNETSYSVRNYRYLNVQEGFPAIVKDNLNSDAICSVKYRLDVSGCVEFEVEESTVLDCIL